MIDRDYAHFLHDAFVLSVYYLSEGEISRQVLKSVLDLPDEPRRQLKAFVVDPDSPDRMVRYRRLVERERYKRR